MERRGLLEQREQQLLIDWLNSVPLESCSRVECIDDIRSGEVLADVVSLLTGNKSLQILRRTQDPGKSIQNFKTILQELSPILSESLRFRPQEFYESPQLLFSLLRWIISVFDAPFYEQLQEAFPELYGKATAKPESKNTMDKVSVEAAFSIKQGSLLDFFKELRVLKHNATYNDVIDACAKGAIYPDLINALEGRQKTIQGIDRNPKTPTARLSNILRALKFLRNCPKMNSRYLWSEKELQTGDLNVIKGFIFDILSFYKRFPKQKDDLLMPPRPNRSVQKPVFVEEQEEEEVFEEPAPEVKTKKYTPIPQVQVPKPKEQQTPEPNPKETIIDWLEKIGLKHLMISNYSLSEDVARNGVLLCEIANLIARQRTTLVYSEPRTVQEVKLNFESAFNIFRVKCPSVPAGYYACIEHIIKGETSIIWAIISCIMQDYPMLTAYCPEVNQRDLPYDTNQLEELKFSLLDWIKSLALLQNKQPSVIQELFMDIRSGVLLCDVIAKTINTPIKGVFKSPRTQSTALANIKKGLDILSRVAKMSQKYVWDAEAILKGNVGVILGLLEDIHRLYDGLPPRKRGPNYHKDGPYLGKKLLKCASVQDMSRQRLRSIDLPAITPGLETNRSPDSAMMSPNSFRRLVTSPDMNKSTGYFKFSFKA